MKPSRLLVFAFLLVGASMPGQNMTDKTGPGSWAKPVNFAAAWAHCKQLLKNDSANTDLNYQAGICYLNSRSQKNKALPYFRKALEANKSNVFMHKLLADAEYAAADFDHAVVHYYLYRKDLAEQNAPAYLIDDIDHRLELCRMGKELKQLRETLNSLASNHSGSSEGSSAASAPNPEPAKIIALADQDFFEDDPNVPTQKAEYNQEDSVGPRKEATVGTSYDGQIILIYRNDSSQGNLYLSMLEGNEWTTPDLVNRIVNLNGWEPGEYISADGSFMYFTSDRAGGYGGKDIYRCLRLSNGEWSKAINLGPTINSPYDDEAPCILPDGVTLYFSSNRNKTKSNFDLYQSAFADSGKWTNPVNVGYPVKKETSLRKNTIERPAEKDNYIVTFNTNKKIPITLLRGKLSDDDNKFPPGTEITITNNVTGELSGVYHPDENSGHYNLILPARRNNNVTFEAKGYLFHSENADLTTEPSLYKVVLPTVLRPVKQNSTEILNNVFFETKSSATQMYSLPELRKLHLFLKDNPGCSIELGCAGTVPGNNNDEARLAEERARSVANYLVEKGIEQERIVTHAYVVPKKKRRDRKKAPTIAISNHDKIEIKITQIKSN